MASWFDTMSDTELQDLLPFFEQLCHVDYLYSVLRQSSLGASEVSWGQNLLLTKAQASSHQTVRVRASLPVLLTKLMAYAIPMAL